MDSEYVFRKSVIGIIRRRRSKGIRYVDIVATLRVFFGYSLYHPVTGKEITDEEIDDLYREATTHERVGKMLGWWDEDDE